MNVSPRSTSRRGQIVSGIAWTTAYRIFASVLQFGSMLVLVRIIPPAEYGRAGVVIGLLGFANVLSCRAFVNQALQLHEGIDPDWSRHWWAGTFIQLTVFGLCNAVAAVFWVVPEYRPVAMLTHIASIGVLIDFPAALRTTMLRRSLDYRRLRLLDGAAKLASVIVTLVMGIAGTGALAIVVGGSVVPAIPAAVDLLLVGRWRPGGRWWRWPEWDAYRTSLRFGLQQSWSALLQAARGALEAAVFPLRLGYAPLGLFQRAQALFTSTVGQANTIFQDTVYPLLPREAHDPARFARVATLFVQIVLLISVPGALFVGSQGTLLSRTLYGEKWIAADPLILPAALAGLGTAAFLAGYGTLLATSSLRACFSLDMAMAAVSLPAILLVFIGEPVAVYVWAVGLGQIGVGSLALLMAARYLERNWAEIVVAPPLLSATAAIGLVEIVELPTTVPLLARILSSLALFSAGFVAVFRTFFPGPLSRTVQYVPGGAYVCRWLRLPSLASSQS